MDERMIALNRPERAAMCDECGSERIAIGRSENIRGQPINPYYCLDCGYVFAQYAGRVRVREYIASTGRLPVDVKTATQEKIAAGKLDPAKACHMKPCEVCGNTGDTERHHWAPFYIFGEVNEDWPQSYLCQKHHVEWHQRVTPDMGAIRD